MSWGTELWDQWDSVGAHTQKGLSFLETYSHFVRDRCEVEQTYARNLRRLSKTYQPKKKEDDEAYTYVKAFRESLSETADLAGQHEVIAEDLGTLVLTQTHNLIKELKEERKKHLLEGNRLQQQYQQSLQSLEKAKKNYEKSFKEADKAQENYHKADADLHLSRAEVEKQRMNASIRNLQAEDLKNEYANQLQKTNEIQGQHFSSLLPGVFLQLQEMDERRIEEFRNLLKKLVDVERGVFPIINKCLDGIVESANRIDQHKDSELVIEKYKSGFTPPSDIPFDDLSTPRPNGEVTPILHPATRQDTIKGTISASKLKKRAGIFGSIFTSNKTNHSFSEKDDFTDLPPNQRKKKIQQKIDEVQQKLNSETAARDGLLKMKEVYTANSSLGNPETITGQLNDSCQTIEKLRAEIERFQSMFDDAEHSASGGPNTPTSNALGRHASNVNGVGASPRSSVASHRTSLSDESLSRSASDSSVCTHTPPPPLPPVLGSTHGVQLSTSTSPPPPSSQSTHISTSTATYANTTYSNATSATNKPPFVVNNNTKLGSSHSPESGIGLSQTLSPAVEVIQEKLPEVKVTYDEPDVAALAEEEEFYDAESLPIIGECQALYQFEATSEGSMQMIEGEVLHLIEVDQGDGWTRVRRRDIFEEGFVPTSYIQITLDNNC